MPDMIKNNPILNNKNSDISAVNAEVHRLQSEAAKDPNHWLHDGLKQHFEEEKHALELLKQQKD